MLAWNWGLTLLERAFEADINAALMPHRLPMIQTRSKLAEKLVSDGLLERVEHKSRDGLATFKGYSLTLAGNLAYCTACADIDPDADAALKDAEANGGMNPGESHDE